VIITAVFTRCWFEEQSPSAADQWGHFSVIGGNFQLLGEAVYEELGVYRRGAMQVWIGFEGAAASYPGTPYSRQETAIDTALSIAGARQWMAVRVERVSPHRHSRGDDTDDLGDFTKINILCSFPLGPPWPAFLSGGDSSEQETQRARRQT
jgi:hypothetical protein